MRRKTFFFISSLTRSLTRYRTISLFHFLLYVTCLLDLLHLIKLYIRDQNQTAACKCFHILDLPAAIKYQVVILNLVFLMALNAGMDTLAILMMESHFPKSVNDPILIEKPNAHYPSYFLVAMALGNDNIIKYMVRVSEQSQHAL